MPRISRRVGLASVTALLRFRVFANTTTTRAPHPPSHDAMTSPFHAGDVGSAIALAKAKGFPLLVAVHTPGDASSDALESVWRDDAVASELRSRWVALRLERLDGDRGADFRSFAALFPVAGAHAVVAINPGDGAVLFERGARAEERERERALDADEWRAEIARCRDAFEERARAAALARSRESPPRGAPAPAANARREPAGARDAERDAAPRAPAPAPGRDPPARPTRREDGLSRRLPNAAATRAVEASGRDAAREGGAARVAAARDEREGEKRKPVFRRKEDDVRGVRGRRDARRGGREARLFSGDDVRSRLGGARRRVADAGLPPRRRRAGRRAVRRRGDGDAGGARQAVHYLAPAQGRRDRPVANDARVPRPRREDLARRRDEGRRRRGRRERESGALSPRAAERRRRLRLRLGGARGRLLLPPPRRSPRGALGLDLDVPRPLRFRLPRRRSGRTGASGASSPAPAAAARPRSTPPRLGRGPSRERAHARVARRRRRRRPRRRVDAESVR